MFTIPRLLSVSSNIYQHQVSRGLLFSSKKGVSRDTLAWIQQPLDFSLVGLLRWWRCTVRNNLVKDHSFQAERHQTLGPDLATAHFVVARSGAIKFEGYNRWVKKNPISGKYSLPLTAYVELKLEAVDVSDTAVMYVSFDNFVNLKHLKYLNVAGCANIDDWCLDRFSMFRDSLLALDISRCPLVTERGLAALHKLRSLRRLRAYDLPAVSHKSLTGLLLEEALPAGCVVEGLDLTDTREDSTSLGGKLPTFLEHYEQFASVAIEQKVKALETAKSEVDSVVKRAKQN